MENKTKEVVVKAKEPVQEVFGIKVNPKKIRPIKASAFFLEKAGYERDSDLWWFGIDNKAKVLEEVACKLYDTENKKTN